jgi:hypothetical protein
MPLPFIMGLLLDDPKDVITIGLSCDPELVIVKWPVNVSPFLKKMLSPGENSIFETFDKDFQGLL